MPRRFIDLSFMDLEVMFVVEHSSGVIYGNQVGGVSCAREELEGVLAPLHISDADARRIMELPYAPGHGLSVEHADAIDAILSTNPGGRFLRVDRESLHRSLEAWVFVVGDTDSYPADGLYRDYMGSVFGFGAVKGVLTWPNSD
jgi:uncharacterized protein DUF6210